MKLPPQIPSGQTQLRPRYFISDRPEAYEIWGEVSREEAEMLSRLIADRASQRFPNIEFLIDGNWHTHDYSTESAAAFIESHWQAWLATMVSQRKTA